MLNHCLINQGHVHRLVVTPDLTGWEVLEEEDSEVVMRRHRDDWHRVECDILLFEIRVIPLRREGWIEFST